MKIAYSDLPQEYPYTVEMSGHEPYDFRKWCYPSVTAVLDSCVLMIGVANEYAQPPSETLRTLIEAGGPWYVVLDRLIEEYPQWSDHFNRAIADELSR